jgi:hypothetical protein
MATKLIKLKVHGYIFDTTTNQYEDNSMREGLIPLTEVADTIADSISSTFLQPQKHQMLIRGVQSAKHSIARKSLIYRVIESGSEIADFEGLDTIFAAGYEGKSTVLHILEGFHSYKPKCRERPQFPVDMWFMFDVRKYENIKYLHPRYNVMAEDKWKRRDPKDPGLTGLIVIN